MDYSYNFVISGLIVALIMNTAAAGATVWLRLSRKYHLSDLLLVPITFPNKNPKGTRMGVVQEVVTIRTILSHQCTLG